MVQGDVHDMGAAMLGGVAGHAGLFAQAIDLAAVFQMLLNKGSYNNKNYLSPQTIEDFIKRGSDISRRALGFDTKEATEGQISKNVAWQASDATYGHTGFTGTSVWADPKQNLVYIFLSNRSYPSGENMKVVSMNIRTRIQEHIYDAMVKKG
jgi:CubicO group peptidase (beta-lactamase class C family)